MLRPVFIILFLGVFGLPAADWKALDISPVWAGHPVGFDLLTAGGKQYVAFYDDQRRMTVGSRRLDGKDWQLVRLPAQLGWDSHNYVTIALDREGYLHLSGNMHVAPLVYYRGSKAGDIASLEQVKQMVGREETRCTYPRFLRGPKGELIFTYRDGRSGSGNQIYNVYDEGSRQWTRLLDQPLTDGEGKSNAYFADPVLGPDGYFHLVWVWRNTPDCATNHDLTYARSKDMRRWETSAGKELPLPIRVSTAEVVDPVPVQGGMINGNNKLGFDSRKRPVITYHKFDEKGFTQIYNARLENGKWRTYRTTDWDYRWEFSGGGSIPFEIRPSAVRLQSGRLLLDYSHVRYGSATWRLDEDTLRPVESLERGRAWPAELEKPEAAGMQVHLLIGKGGGKGSGGFLLRWETLGPNRDRPRTGELPGPTMLRLYSR
ncbi:MAG: BNR-4 repeat-containing protein [Acidobacteria bacterium]|nr:BNR-4 repeat-containing protein [Acidobacteriota bacterium]